jgi:hypothetical protein
MAGQKKKVRSKAIIQSSDEGEGFDLNVSDSSSDSAATPVVRHSGSRTSRPPAAAAVEPTVVDPVGPTPPTVLVNADAAKLLAPIPTTGSSRSPQAQDTKYFYVTTSIDVKGEMTVRKVCKLCS